MDDDSIQGSEDSRNADYDDLGSGNSKIAVVDGSMTPLIEKKDGETKRGVNALQLTMMIYFFTSGGPFGIEPAVGAAGPLLTLISLVVIPLFWSLPQALMSAELALMMDQNGGNVLWVQRAFGDFIGWVNAWNNLVAQFASMSLLTVLFVEYLPQNDLPLWSTWLIKFGFVTLITVLNILGLRWVSRLSVFFLIIIMGPFVSLIVMAFKDHHVNFAEIAYVPPVHEIQWSLFLSTVIWSYGGFDSMGSMAGEVKGGRATYIKGIAGSMPLIIINYIGPVIFGYFQINTWQTWSAGYFTDVGYNTAQWLGIWMVAASALSNFGQYNAAQGPLARVIWAMAREKGTAQKLPKFLAISWKRKTGTIRPYVAILATGFFTFVGAGLPYNFLVQVFLVVRIVNLLCEYGALIRLKYSEPDTHRPFVVPGGKIGAWLLGVPTVGLAGFALAFADWHVWVTGISANAAILILYGLKILYQKYVGPRFFHKHDKRQSNIQG